MSSIQELQEKVKKINNKLNNKEFEEALTLLESLSSYSSKMDNYEDNILQIIKKLFYKLINEKKFEEAINKIYSYKWKYSRYYKDLQKIESLIYYHFAIKENEEGKFDDALSHLERSSNLDSDNNEKAQILSISILIFNKKLYDKALQKISNLEYSVSREKIQQLKTLKASALNNKASDLAKTDLEESLNLVNKAIEIESVEHQDIFKRNRYDKFSKLFAKRIIDKQFEEIPKLFEKTQNYKFKSEDMEKYLDVNQHISNFFKFIYLNKVHTKETYEKIITNCLEYLRKGTNEENFRLKYEVLKVFFSENIKKDTDLFLEKNNVRKKPKIYEIIIETINNYIQKYKDNDWYIDLKSYVIFDIAQIYFEKDNKIAKKLFTEFLDMKEEEEREILEGNQVEANINLCQIDLDEREYFSGYTKIENLLKLIGRKYAESNIDFEWPNESFIEKINRIKMDCLLKYIEKTLDEIKFTNLDDYFEKLIYFKEEVKDQLLDIKDIEEKVKSFQIKYMQKKLTNLMETKNYQKCINLCDEFLSSESNNKKNFCPDYIKREIMHIKIECMKEISDILIKQNKKDEFMKKIKEISLLQKEIDYGLGENKNQ